MRNLYAFDTILDDAVQQYGAPRLIPAGNTSGAGANYLMKDSSSFKLIDVINDHQWTTSPPSSRERVPSIVLKEKRLKNNALYAQVAYYGLALGQAIGGGIGSIKALPDPVRNIFSGVLGGFAGGVINDLGQAIFGGGGAGSTLSDLISRAAGFGLGYNLSPEALETGWNTSLALMQVAGRNLPDQFNFESLNNTMLAPYEGLYITEDTKFIYQFPYFNDEQNFVSNAFGDYDEALGKGGIDPLGAAGAAAATRDAAMFTTGVFNFDAPGIYIEKPKFFNFKEDGERIKFRFPLVNTGWSTFEDVQRNWQLMYLLTYQNRPNRKTRNLIDPAVIYEITIPGIRYYPFAYISEMSIGFAGARRKMSINVPVRGGTGSRLITTIVPDAYIVDITLTTLVSETQNFLYAMLNKQDLITTSTQQNPFDVLASEGMTAIANSTIQNLNPATRSGFNAIFEGINPLIKNAANGGVP